MGRMIEEKINEEIKSFIYLNYKIIGYHYKGEIYFNHYSAENTIKAETNSKGQTKYFDYGFDSDFNEANVLYYGQYKDEFTGLYYNYHRDYSHQMKRYLQIDPLGLTDGTNPYIYVKNNALNYFDFYGLCSCNKNKDPAYNAIIEESIEESKKYLKYKEYVNSWDGIRRMPEEYESYNLFNFTNRSGENSYKCTAFVYSMFIKSGQDMPFRETKTSSILDNIGLDGSKQKGTFGANSFYNLEGDISKYFEEVKREEAKKNDLIVKEVKGSNGHIGIVLDPTRKWSISASSASGAISRHNTDKIKDAFDYYYGEDYKILRSKCNCEDK